MLCVDIVRESGRINDKQWDYFLRGACGVEKTLPTKPKADWLTEEVCFLIRRKNIEHEIAHSINV